MAIDIITWIMAGGFAAMVVLVVVLIMMYIRPAMTCFAWDVIKAKKRKTSLSFLDDGTRWIIKVEKAHKCASPGVIMPDDNIPIEITSKSQKYAPGGILLGIGEHFRSKLANTMLVDLLTIAESRDWSGKKLAKKIADIEQMIEDSINNKNDGIKDQEDRKEELLDKILTNSENRGETFENFKERTKDLIIKIKKPKPQKTETVDNNAPIGGDEKKEGENDVVATEEKQGSSAGPGKEKTEEDGVD